MKKTPKTPKISMDRIVAECLTAGWRWVRVYDSKVNFLTPPHGDRREVWCAEWKEWKKDYVIPHWASPTPHPYEVISDKEEIRQMLKTHHGLTDEEINQSFKEITSNRK